MKSTDESLTLADLRQVEKACQQFEAAWQSGQRPRIEDYLPNTPEPLRTALLQELLQLDLAYQQRLGEVPTAAQYLQRFPERGDLLLSLLPHTNNTLLAAAARAAPSREQANQPFPPLRRPHLPGYEILEELGRGGMGVVYKAKHLQLNRIVALKMILAGSLADPEQLVRFLAEAEAVAQLQHPHIVQLFEIGQHDDLPFFVLEFVPGGNLEEKVHDAPLVADEAARLVEALARGMAHAHRRGIVHRDLKPQNVLLSADGTPKITDFGLAKRIEVGMGLTQTGVVMGTPSYMAPEQASGQAKTVGPAADVYALGAILYRLLTGRPPFQGPTMLDTLQQVIGNEPVPPSHLQSAVPRDLETICLKCLHKEPARRYAHALDLAEDLRRFQVGEPIAARPVGRAERMRKWVRRQPTRAALLALVFLLVVAVTGATLWYLDDWAARTAAQAHREAEQERKRALTEQSVRQTLGHAQKLRSDLQEQLRQPGGVFLLLNEPTRWQGQIKAALSEVDHARALQASAEGSLAADLIEQLKTLQALLQRDEADRKLALHLEKVRLDMLTTLLSRMWKVRQRTLRLDTLMELFKGEREYPMVFLTANPPLAVEDGEIHAVVGQIRQSPIKEQLVVLLDEWAFIAHYLGKTTLAKRLLEVGRLTAPNPWGDQVRSPAVWQDRPALEKLIATAPPKSKMPPQMVFLVGALLWKNQADDESWMRAGQAQYPADFWLNLGLGFLLQHRKPTEAVGFYRAALAVRPQIGGGFYFNLGQILREQNDMIGAIGAYQQAVDRDFQHPYLYHNWGLVLESKGDLDGAIAKYRKASELDPKYAPAYSNWGWLLHQKKNLEGAIAKYQKASELDPKSVNTYLHWGVTLQAKGDLDGAIAKYQQAIALDPRHAETHHRWGFALYTQGHLDGAIAKYQTAIASDPKLAYAYSDWGWILLLKKDLDGAIVKFQKAVAIDPKIPLFYIHWGIALQAKGNLDGALTQFQKAVELNPTDAWAHNHVGEVLQAKGDFAKAIGQFRTAAALSVKESRFRDNLQHCEQLLALDLQLAAILQSPAQPPSAVQQLALAELCHHYKKQYAAAARFYAGAFSGAPDLTGDLTMQYRYRAASAAALAASGQGKDADKLDEKAKATLRQQALNWLQADLDQCRNQAKSKESAILQSVCKQLSQWQADPNLTSVRDAKTLAKLPHAELHAWQKFWSDVNQLVKQTKAGP